MNERHSSMVPDFCSHHAPTHHRHCYQYLFTLTATTIIIEYTHQPLPPLAVHVPLFSTPLHHLSSSDPGDTDDGYRRQGFVSSARLGPSTGITAQSHTAEKRGAVAVAHFLGGD